VFALGECAEHRGTCYGLVEPAYEQARVLARHLAGAPAAYNGSVVATNLKVSGVGVFSAGDFMGSEGSESIVLSDFRHGTYKKLVIAEGRLTGAVLVGETADALWYLDMIRNRPSVAAIRSEMMFGRPAAAQPKAA
jgi:nitrite reductase (NADH) large subunit